MHGGAGEKGRGQNDGDHPAQHSAYVIKGLNVGGPRSDNIKVI